MTRLTTALFLCMCMLMPATASADDGGWLDWLFRMDMKFVGYGSEVHLLCLDNEGRRLRCEDLWGIPRLFGFTHPDRDADFFDRLKHEVDFRFAFYHKYGERFPDLHDTRAVYAWKLLGMYYYRVNTRVAVGGGAGALLFSGTDVHEFSRGVITPVSVLVHLGKGWSLRPEVSYLTGGMTGADFGNPATTFSKQGEWNPSVAIGYDFRRRIGRR
jgi:hypothetical protein